MNSRAQREIILSRSKDDFSRVLLKDRKGDLEIIMTIHVRQAGPEDKAAIVDLIQELATSGGDASPLDEAYVEVYLSVPGNSVLLAEGEGQALGLISCSLRPNLYHAGPAALIEELVVGQEQRGQGIGGLLLQELLARLESLGCVEVAVSTMPDNEGAQRFYRAHGLVDEAVFLEKHF